MQLHEIIETQIEVIKQTIPKVHKQNRLNLILVGSDKVGKTTVIQELAKFQKRGVVNLNELKEWNIQNKT